LILVDTSVWVDHLRRGDARLAVRLESASVLTHPFIIGELACGHLADRALIIELLSSLPIVNVADPGEVLAFIESSRLYGGGIGYVDMHLLAAVMLTPGVLIWTRDKRLRTAAMALGRAFMEAEAH
jgi:hypothetical protein